MKLLHFLRKTFKTKQFRRFLSRFFGILYYSMVVRDKKRHAQKKEDNKYEQHK